MHVNQDAVIFICRWIIKSRGGRGFFFFLAHNKQQSPAQITAEAVATRGQEAVCNWQAALTERESCE